VTKNRRKISQTVIPNRDRKRFKASV